MWLSSRLLLVLEELFAQRPASSVARTHACLHEELFAQRPASSVARTHACLHARPWHTRMHPMGMHPMGMHTCIHARHVPRGTPRNSHGHVRLHAHACNGHGHMVIARPPRHHLCSTGYRAWASTSAHAAAGPARGAAAPACKPVPANVGSAARPTPWRAHAHVHVHVRRASRGPASASSTSWARTTSAGTSTAANGACLHAWQGRAGRARARARACCCWLCQRVQRSARGPMQCAGLPACMPRPLDGRSWLAPRPRAPARTHTTPSRARHPCMVAPPPKTPPSSPAAAAYQYRCSAAD